MVGRASTVHPRVDSAVAAVAGVVATVLAAFVFEALTDRDWSLQGWEWLEVTAFALLLSFGASRVILLALTRSETRRGISRPPNGPRRRTTGGVRERRVRSSGDPRRRHVPKGRGSRCVRPRTLVTGETEECPFAELARRVVPLQVRRPVGISLFHARVRFNLARRQALARLPFLAARDLVYDDWYYDKIDRKATELYNRLAETLVDIRSPASVVDVGCGTGIILKRFADAVWTSAVSKEASRLSAARRLATGSFAPTSNTACPTSGALTCVFA